MAKMVLKGRFIALNANNRIEEEKKSQTIILPPKILETRKAEQNKPNASRRKKIMKNRN